MTVERVLRRGLVLLAIAAVGAASLALIGCDSSTPTDGGSGAAAEPQAKFVNTRCPMMKNPIKPDEVPDKLTREFKGQKVAFCCPGCPDAWDKLTGAEKTAKLAKAK